VAAFLEGREMPSGKVIFLNGTTSSGKSSLAQALQRILAAPYLHANADAIKEMSLQIPPAEQGEPFTRSGFMPILYAAIPSCFASLASFGNNLIIEDVTRPLQLRNYVEAFIDCDVQFIGVHCSLEKLERREQERGDRRIGRAKEQLQQGLVHALGIYDLEVDTTRESIEACALSIKRHLELGIRPTAFKRLSEVPVEELWQKTDAIDQSIYQAAHPEVRS
jgi:chloramphenicol 3-O phosphotransferase